MQKARQHDQFFFKDTVRHKKKNGQVIHVEIHSDTIIIDGKKARLAVINDVTERINYFGAIEKQNEKLREIAWIQSHIVRAPLARMLGIINLVKELKTESRESEALLGYLVDSCNELDTIIIDIANKSHKVNIDD
jgi:light-regulated signal transduction histidine kinase (bacteriophytochrome)